MEYSDVAAAVAVCGGIRGPAAAGWRPSTAISLQSALRVEPVRSGSRGRNSHHEHSEASTMKQAYLVATLLAIAMQAAAHETPEHLVCRLLLEKKKNVD